MEAALYGLLSFFAAEWQEFVDSVAGQSRGEAVLD
jgi:hypothetical protein